MKLTLPNGTVFTSFVDFAKSYFGVELASIPKFRFDDHGTWFVHNGVRYPMPPGVELDISDEKISADNISVTMSTDKREEFNQSEMN